MKHKEWLDNEYRLWIEALNSCTVNNFKDHPMVKRMLGEIDWEERFLPMITSTEKELIRKIDNIGRSNPTDISGTCWRMVYYACQVLHRQPQSIIEIGGGVGQFYAVLRALGYKGDYFIQDLPEVMLFQNSYLRMVHLETKLNTTQSLHFDYCVSFYALGEFDDETKAWYKELVIDKCPHGFVIWNPHSGATPTIPFKCEVKDEYPLLAEGNKQLEW